MDRGGGLFGRSVSNYTNSNNVAIMAGIVRKICGLL